MLHSYRHTRRMCNTYCYSAVTIVTWGRLSVTLYLHCLSCSYKALTDRDLSGGCLVLRLESGFPIRITESMKLKNVSGKEHIYTIKLNTYVYTSWSHYHCHLCLIVHTDAKQFSLETTVKCYFIFVLFSPSIRLYLSLNSSDRRRLRNFTLFATDRIVMFLCLIK
jgi:hypothetical protein